MKMGCHVIFSCRDLTSFLGVTEHTDYTESRAIPPKISRSFQFKKNFITREIRRKSRHFPSRHTTTLKRRRVSTGLRCERIETIIHFRKNMMAQQSFYY